MKTKKVKLKGLKAKVESNPQYKVPHRIYDIDARPSNEEPREIAESLLKKIAPNLKITPDLSQLKFDKVKESILGSHVFYQQYYEDKPISGAWIRVDIDKDGKVYNLLNELIPEPNIAKTKKTEAKRKATSATTTGELSLEESKFQS